MLNKKAFQWDAYCPLVRGLYSEVSYLRGTRVGGPCMVRSHVQQQEPGQAGSLYSEAQCIIGNRYMGPYPRQNDRRRITFVLSHIECCLNKNTESTVMLMLYCQKKIPVNSSYPSPMFKSTVPNITGLSFVLVSSCKRVEKATGTSTEKEAVLITFQLMRISIVNFTKM